MTSLSEFLENPPWTTFDLRNLSFAVGRTVIAIAQLTIVVFTPASQYFQPIAGEPRSPQCEGLLAATAYCIADRTLGLWLGHVLCGIIFILVVSGLYPRVTAWLHVWATFSIGLNFALTDGGESVAQFATVLIAVTAIADSRRNHWILNSRSTTLKANTRALAWVGWNAARIQLAFIYFYSATAKLTVDRWVDGSAFYYFVRDPMFGTSGPLKTVLLEATRNPILVAGITWTGIVVQLLIAILILRGPWSRAIALILDIVLHLGILSVMGLWSFSLIMIGYAIFCCGNDWKLLNRIQPMQPIDSPTTNHQLEGSVQNDG